MKYLIIGDLHGSDLSILETILKIESPNILICLGDFDQTKTIHQFIELEKLYETIKVSGNHDHAILNDLPIVSQALIEQGKTSHQLHEELEKDDVAKKYIEKLMNSKEVKILLNKSYPTIIIHGAYVGDLSSFPNCPPDIKTLWSRLITKADCRKNFKAMNKRGYKVMIRGHDHIPVYAYEEKNKIVVHNIQNSNVHNFKKIKLLKNRKHLINPGAFYNKIFATIEMPILKFHKFL